VSYDRRRVRWRYPFTAALVLVVVGLGALQAPDVWERHRHPLRYEREIAAASTQHGIDPYLVTAVINAESGFDPRQRSPKGALGLMQLMPPTAEEVAARLGMDTPLAEGALYEPALSIELGTAHLATLVRRYGDAETAIAAYNAGAARVDEWLIGGSIAHVIDYPETRAFADRVLAEREIYVRLYPGAFQEE